jgi:hypothetical protein
MEKREVVEAKGVRRYLSGIIKKSRFLLRMSPSSGKIELTHIPLEACDNSPSRDTGFNQ